MPLFDVLDGQRSEDFVARVEPSAIGGRKMAEYIWVLAKQPTSVGVAGPPATSYMEERN